MVEAATREQSGWLDVRPAEAGMPLVGWLPGGLEATALSPRERITTNVVGSCPATPRWEKRRSGLAVSRLVAALT